MSIYYENLWCEFSKICYNQISFHKFGKKRVSSFRALLAHGVAELVCDQTSVDNADMRKPKSFRE
jgi:hypothetical protein